MVGSLFRPLDDLAGSWSKMKRQVVLVLDEVHMVSLGQNSALGALLAACQKASIPACLMTGTADHSWASAAVLVSLSILRCSTTCPRRRRWSPGVLWSR